MCIACAERDLDAWKTQAVLPIEARRLQRHSRQTTHAFFQVAAHRVPFEKKTRSDVTRIPLDRTLAGPRVRAPQNVPHSIAGTISTDVVEVVATLRVDELAFVARPGLLARRLPGGEAGGPE